MRPPFAIVDFAEPGDGPLLFRDPAAVLVANALGEVRGVLRTAEAAARAGRHLVGYVAYDAAPAFDAALRVRSGESTLPLAWFGIFGEPEPWTGHAATSAVRPATEASRVAGRMSQVDAEQWIPTESRREHAAAVQTIRETIAAGGVYQVNYTLRLRAPVPRDPLALWQRLARAQRAGWAAYLDLGEHQLLSVSPELFFRREGRRVTTRPMKGTAPRGRWLEEDDARAAALAASEKDRAENVMIVDLLRNDLGRVAEPGSVHVPTLFAVERYPTVLQLTSTVEATLRRDVDLDLLFEALFPCGSVTGAPKVAAMRLVSALEETPRGAYCGAIGHLRPGGDAAFNVAIRTAHVDCEAGRVEYGVGGGVTWDSTSEAEYDEALTKAAVLTVEQPAVELIETMRLEHGVVQRLEGHLARLAASARHLGFTSPTAVAREALAAAATALGDGAWRLRLLASPDGTVRVEHASLPPTPARPVVALASRPVSRDDPFLFHKTTHRTVYESRRAEHPEAFDVLLRNAEGELTEFTIGNLVVELDGGRWTPPRDSGLLAGVFRAELLERGLVRERVLRVMDLTRATRVWLVNSLREWVEVELPGEPG